MNASHFPSVFPPQHLPLFMKHFWVMFIVVTLVNARIFWSNLKVRIQKQPELEPGYRNLILAYAVLANLPWLGMGLGILTGRTNGVLDYLMPSQGNPFVIDWWIGMVCIMAGVGFWLFTGGAEILEKYPGLPMVSAGGAGKIKLLFLVTAGFQLLMTVLIFMGFPFSLTLSNGKNLMQFTPFLFPVFFIGMWLAVSWILSEMSGWKVLLKDYPAIQPFEGKQIIAAGQFGMVRYNGVLKLGANREGLYLSLIFLFRMGSPPLFIPWKDIKTSEQKSFFTDMAVVEFAKSPGIIFKTRKKTVLQLKEEAKSPYAFPEISST